MLFDNFLVRYFYESLEFLRQSLCLLSTYTDFFFLFTEKELGNFVKLMNYYELHWEDFPYFNCVKL